ncbi:MAG: hypothetical protein C4341_03800 [Armatimonadota bacterium]
MVSALAVALLGISAQQGGVVPPLSEGLLSYVSPRVATLLADGQPVGQTVFVAPDGAALTSADVLPVVDGKVLTLRAAGGTLAARFERVDAVTGLALLRPSSPLTGVPYTLVAPSVPLGVGLAMLPSGPARASVTQVNVPGIVGDARTYIPLTEVCLEGTQDTISGTPVFDTQGRLIAILSSSLNGAASAERAAPAVGPSQPVVAFSVTSLSIRRTLAGMLDPKGASRHPYVGIRYAEQDGGRVIITEVSPGGPAASVGLKPGERIVRVGVTSVRSALDVATYLYLLEPGSMAVLTLEQAGITRTVMVPVVPTPSAKP